MPVDATLWTNTDNPVLGEEFWVSSMTLDRKRKPKQTQGEQVDCTQGEKNQNRTAIYIKYIFRSK